MTAQPTDLPDVVEFRPRTFADARGWFRETWSTRQLDEPFCQDNESMSVPTGTLRGIHFQKHPFAQGKLVRVETGAILDVAVDLRVDSPTFRQWVGVRLDAETGNQLWIPVGFGHGFVTLEPDTKVAYKVTALYDPASERSIIWNDANLGVDWGDEVTPVLSDKDAAAPTFAEVLEAGDLF
ncbi:MAG: dTDP-4-dehydrorhamnose 3,5-epimerase [Acidimicrobiales bacterium]